MLAIITFSQIPSGYYDSAQGKTGSDLKTALHNIIKNPSVDSYSDLWTDFTKTDVDNYYENDGSVLDIYSENPSGSDPYNFSYTSDQCGSYSAEGDCYNREHSFPKSWFNDSTPMYSDLFHIYPTDGYVNNRRANYAYGEVSNPTWTSQNGGKLGPCSVSGFSGTVFEPIDEYKGDIARSYFYMATCYEPNIATWQGFGNADDVLDGTTYPCFDQWFIDMLISWHENDPVSQKEIDRNDSIYKIQGNRNPFIDHPEWVECIWLNQCSSTSLSASPSSLSGFSYTEGSGPSSSQSFDLSGSDLDGTDVTLSAPTDYEISTDNSSFSTSITLTAYDGTTTTIYVRLKAGLSAGTYNGELITISGGGASDITVSNDGSVSSASSGGSGCASDLIISEYGEGSKGNSKYIEIYNGTGSTVNLSDYQLWRISNGGSWPEATYNFTTATLADGATLVVANNKTDVPGADEYDSGFASWNGDDAVGLAKDDGTGNFVLLDAVGEDGADPGSGWDVAGTTNATKDHYLIRKSSVTSPNTDWDASRGTNTSNSEWEVYSYESGSAQSGHTMDCASPTLTANPNSLSGFSYIVNHGPSSSQNFDLSGSNLDGSNVTLTAPTDYEISTDNSSFYASLTLNSYNGSSTTIYVRLKAGLSVGTYNNEQITISGGGASDIYVTLDGEVVASTLTVNPTSISGFSYLVGNGPSSSQSFSLSGDNLDGSQVTITAPSDYEVSTDNSTFTNSVTVSYTAPTLNATTIYVRLKAGLSVGTYNNENITCSDDGQASDVTVTLNGEVVEPTLNANPNSLTGFSYSEGAGPSASQNFDLTGSNLDGTDVTLSAPTDYEISTDNSTFSNSITLSSYDGSSQTIYVRLKAGLSQGTYNGEQITISGGGASNITVTLDGEVTAPSASCATDLIISEYCEGSGNNKYIEIYNNTGAAVNLDDYRIGLISNGGSWTETAIAFTSGTVLANDDTWVLANSNADQTVLDNADQTSGSLGFNGDDAVALQYSPDGGTTWNNIDIIGEDGADPGTGWDVAGTTNATANHTLIRKSTVFSPETNWATSAGTNTSDSQWEVYTQDYFDNMGIHTMQCTCDRPTADATNIVFSSITSTSLTLTWTNGDGSKRIVVAKEALPVDWTPSDSTTYTANSVFASGTELGTGNYVVYNGSGNSVTVTGLIPGTTYYFKIFEYGCSPGAELYLTTGTPAEGNETTLPNDITNLSVNCTTTSSMELSWNLPTGDFDGILVTILQGATPDAPSCDGSSLTNPITDYSSADVYCSNTSGAVYVFNNVGTSVSISGLTSGASYTVKIFVYKNSAWSLGVATTQTAQMTEVDNLQANCGNTESQITWSNPNAACFDEVMIVASDASISATPSGDGSAYTANSSYGSGTDIGTNEFVVYKGTGELVDVTNLSNGTTYYFKAFVRKGTDWSAGTEVSCMPSTAVKLNYGDLAIVGINTHIIEYDNNQSDDDIQIVCFVDITTGTSIDFTDNGYERVSAGKWGDSEGTIRFTRTGADVPAGTVITFRGMSNTANPQLGTDYDVYICGTNDNANWSVSSINNSGTTGGPYDLNVDDQIWMMQGGNWDNGGSLGDHDATYSGKVLYGWTAVGWKSAPGYNNTKGSTVYPGTECSNTNLSGVANHDKVKYTGPTGVTSQLGWIGRFNDPGNWTGYTDSTNYVNGGSLPCQIDINYDVAIAQWTGNVSTDWDSCANWLNLRVPDASTDVVFVADDCNNDIVIRSGQTVACHDLSISGSTLDHAIKLEGDNTSIIEIHGDLTIDGPDNVLDLDDGTSADDGIIKIYGNWTNNKGANAFLEGNSTVQFVGNTTQSITTSDTKEDFYNLTISNSSSNGVTLSKSVQTNGTLNMQTGVLNLNGNDITISGEYTRTNAMFAGNSTSNLTINNTGNLSSALYFAEPQELNSLTMDRGGQTAELATNLSMNDMTISNGQVQLDAGKFFTVSNNLTNSVGATGLLLKSDATGTASLIQNSENVPATCERYIAGNVWAYIFTPLSNVPTSTFNSGNPNFYWYDEAEQDYWDATTIYGTTGWKNEPNSNLSTNKGYISYYPNAKVYNLSGGNLYFDATNNNKVFTLTYNDSGSGAVNQDGVTADWDDFEGWNLIGNPFTSAIDWNQVTLNNVENVVYYYDGESQNYKYFGTGTNYNQGITVSGGSQYVPANQGFFVKTITNGGTVTIPNSARTHNAQQFWKSQTKEPENIIRLKAISQDFEDETVIVFDNNATDLHDNFDGYKLFAMNKSVPQIYTIDSKSAVYALNIMPFADTKVIPLGFFDQDAGNYVFSATKVNIWGYHVYLNDKKQNILTNLQNTPNYEFTFNGGNNVNRFELFVSKNHKPYNVLPLPDKFEKVGDYFIFSIPKNTFADQDMGDYLTLSAQLENGDALPEWITFENGKFSGFTNDTATLRIKVIATDKFNEQTAQTFTLTVFANETGFNVNSSNINIFPNPAKTSITVIIPEILPNTSIKIFDMSGKTVKETTVSNEKTTIDVSYLAKGIYIINVKNDAINEQKELIIK